MRIRSPVRRGLQRERAARGKTETEITIITGAEILRIKTENRSSAGKTVVRIKTAATEKVTTATVATTVRNVTEGTITVVTITITTSKKIMNSRISLKEGERIDDLQISGLQIIQDPKRFCFGMDAVLLSGFVKCKSGDNILDIGTGTGILPLLLSAKTEAAHITGI